VFPLRDDNPHFLTPVITYGLIAANVLAWALLQGFGSDPMLGTSICRLGLIPGELLQTAPPGARFPIDENVHAADLDVHARRLDAPDREHVVLVDLRQ
jgi:hypothetical protein